MIPSKDKAASSGLNNHLKLAWKRNGEGGIRSHFSDCDTNGKIRVTSSKRSFRLRLHI